jgi:general secretion pathway protein I
MRLQPPRACRPTRGFTLLEVLVALAIFLMAAVVLAASYINILMSYEAANRAVARNQDVEFARAAIMLEPDREAVEKGGEFDAGNGRRVNWKATIDTTDMPDVYLVTFDCSISAPDLKQPENVQQRFRLLRPTWAKGDDRDKLRGKVRDRINEIVSKQKQS